MTEEGRAEVRQLALPFEVPRVRLLDRVRPHLVEGMRLVETRNRVSLYSFKRDGDAIEIRISERMEAASDEVLESAVRWARGGPGSRKAARIVRDYVRRLPPDPGHESLERMQPQGRVHDLAELLERTRTHYTPEVRVGGVGWAIARRMKRRRGGAVRLASYQDATRAIRVHPALDAEAVPEWVLEFLLFHELLHARFGAVPDAAGRMRYHTREFNAAERAHPDYDRFRRWERGPLTRVLNRWDRGE